MKPLRFLFFLFAFSCGATLLYLQLTSPQAQGNVPIEIRAGETVQDIAETLKREGLIRSALLFRFYLESRGLDRALRAGKYLLPPEVGYGGIVEALTGGAQGEVIITIPEGYTIAQIDALLTQKNLIKAGDLLACAKEKCDFSSFTFLPGEKGRALRGGRLEGYLFPETYYVSAQEFVHKFFLERMLGVFRERVVENLRADIATSGRSLHDIVVMASLIERETRGGEERPVVSGILWKRLDAGRALDVDATVRYALGRPTGPLTKEDLEFHSSYNTRRSAGLPPGPIANPGLESIMAALHPEESTYWYYLHGKNGEIHYAETNDQHNENRVRYL